MLDILGIIFAAFAVISLVITIMSFMEKGFVFNNPYIWATKQERKTMNKKPLYKQSAVAFAIITLISLCMAVEFFLVTTWLWIVVLALSLTLFVYVVVSQRRIDNDKLKQ